MAPARRSDAARRRASTRGTPAGRPTESFATLEELATLTRNEIRIPGRSQRGAFEMLSTPTELQRRAFDLLEVKIPTQLA